MRKLYILALFVLPSLCLAQKEATHWYFGENAGITFESGPPQVLLDGALVTGEGCATMSDRITGDLLFYTDGITVWNYNHSIITTNLAGHNSSTQSALIVPYPGFENRFFIFTSGQVSDHPASYMPEFRFSIADMANGVGRVNLRNILLLDSTAEKQSATWHCNGEDYWVVTHHMTRNAFYAFHITKDGVNPDPVISIVGKEPIGFNSYGAGYLKISPNGQMIAVVSTFDNALFNTQQLFDFDNATGIVRNGRVVKEDEPVYGVSFSPDNSKLYMIGGFTHDLYQYDLSVPDEANIQASETVIANFAIDAVISSPFQIGPDGKIYVGMFEYLGVVHKPNEKGLACDFRKDDLFLEGRRCNIGLPNFIDAWFNESENDGLDCAKPISKIAADTVLCQGDSLHVQDFSTRRPDVWRWTFEGGQPEQFEGQHPPLIHYPDAGEFTVVLETENANGSDRDSLRVTVFPRPIVASGPDITICQGEQAQLIASGASSYQWTPNVTLSRTDIPNPIATPTETIEYIVTGTNEFGCFDRDTVRVIVADRAEAIVSADTATCAGQSIRLQASGGVNYLWTPTTYLDDPQSPTPLATPPTDAAQETIVYSVRVSSGQCVSTASVSVRINALPEADAGPDRMMCPGESVQLSGRGDGSYAWTPAEGLNDPTIANPTATLTETTTYRLTVTSTEGCTAFDETTVTVEADLNLTVQTPAPICAGDSVQLFAEGANEYHWEPAEFFRDPTEQNPWVSPTTNQRFTVRGRTGGCEGVAAADVAVHPLPEVKTGPATAICIGESARLRATGGVTYQWSPTDGLSDPNAAQTEARPERSTVYTVVVANADGCRDTAQTRVAVVPRAEIIIEAERVEDAAFPGDTRSVGIFLRATPQALAQASIDSIDLMLTYDGRGLGYEETGVVSGAASPRWTWRIEERPEDGLLYLRGSGPPIAAAGTLCAIPFQVFVSKHRDLFSDIEIIEAYTRSSGMCYGITPNPGGITLSPYCLANSRAIELTDERYNLSAPRPNPASENVEVLYSVGIAGHTKVTIYSALGEAIHAAVDAYKKAGSYSVTVGGLLSGAYYCVMESGPYRATRALYILR